MKRLYFEILGIVLIIAMVLIFLEYQYKGYKNAFDVRFEKLEKQKDSIEVIYIGNSHMGAFKKISISGKNAFNLSFGGQDLFHMMVVLEKYIPQTPQLHKIILGCDYDMLGYNLDIANQQWKDRQYYPYVGKLYDQSLSNKIMATSNFFRANRDLKYLFRNNENTANKEINFIPISDKKLSKEGCKDRATEHSVIKYDHNYFDENYGYLKKIISICKKHNVSLIVINPPKSECYWNYYQKDVISSNSEAIKKLAQQNKIPFIDLYSSKSFTKDCFIDYDHLNEKGVKKLLEILEHK